MLNLRSSILLLLLELMTLGITQNAKSEILIELKNFDEMQSENDTSKAAAPPEASELTFQFRMPLEKLSAMINQFRFKIPAGGDSVTSVRVAVSSSGVSDYPLRLRVPMKLNVVGTALDGVVTLDIGIGVAPDGCPLKIRTPSVEFPDGGIVGFFVSGKVASEILAQLSCDRIKEQLTTVWKTLELPIEVGSNTIYVNFGPQRIGISDLKVDSKREEVIFGGSLSAIVALTSRRGQGPKAPPLNLSRIDPPGSSGVSGSADFSSKASLFFYLDLGRK